MKIGCCWRHSVSSTVAGKKLSEQIYLHERPAIQRVPRDSLRHRVSYTPVETERAFTFEAGGDMFQKSCYWCKAYKSDWYKAE